MLLTGHTGFKGAWLTLWLEHLGAEMNAVALPPATTPNLFEALAPWPHLVSVFGDLREPETVAMVTEAAPEIVIHLAAQALVRPSYDDPAGTFASNVLGTVHLLEAVRRTPSVKVVLVVTSDKVYHNDNRGQPFREDDRLGGRDPYSASKVCQEIVTTRYRESFFSASGVRVASARAGNVIGGGDWAADRLIPDFVRAAEAGRPVTLRYPEATRPWQHVLEPLAGYLDYAERLYAGDRVPPALNFGPAADDVQSVRWVIEQLLERWGDGAGWRADKTQTMPEMRRLTLDASLATQFLGWQPRLVLKEALDWTVAWYRAHDASRDMRSYSVDQIRRYQERL